MPSLGHFYQLLFQSGRLYPFIASWVWVIKYVLLDMSY